MVERPDEKPDEKPVLPALSPIAIALVGVLSFAGGFCLLFFTFLSYEFTLVPRIAGSVFGGLVLCAAGLVSLRSLRFRPLLAFSSGMGAAVVGGPLSLGVAMVFKGFVQGAGVRALAGLIVAPLGLACGWFISIPVGLVVGALLALLVWLASKIPARG